MLYAAHETLGRYTNPAAAHRTLELAAVCRRLAQRSAGATRAEHLRKARFYLGLLRAYQG